jgi:hypothetical protein
MILDSCQQDRALILLIQGLYLEPSHRTFRLQSQPYRHQRGILPQIDKAIYSNEQLNLV